MREAEMASARYDDVEDFTSLARETRRVLAADGHLVYVGLHPCFTGPFAEQPRADGARVVHPGYAQTGWLTRGPGSVAGGLASRVGFRHLPIARVLNGCWKRSCGCVASRKPG